MYALNLQNKSSGEHTTSVLNCAMIEIGSLQSLQPSFAVFGQPKPQHTCGTRTARLGRAQAWEHALFLAWACQAGPPAAPSWASRLVTSVPHSHTAPGRQALPLLNCLELDTEQTAATLCA